MRNTSSQTRRAVIEQIIAKLSKSEIGIVTQKMDDYKNSLEGLKKTEFELYSKDSYEQIKHCYKVVCLIVIAIYTATNGWAQPESEWESFALNVAAYDYEDMPVDPYPESNLFDGEIKTCWVCGSEAIIILPVRMSRCPLTRCILIFLPDTERAGAVLQKCPP